MYTHMRTEGNPLIWALTVSLNDCFGVWIAISNGKGLTRSQEPFAARRGMLCWPCQRRRQRSSPAPAAAARPSSLCPHSSHQAERQMQCSPCTFNAKWLFFLVQELPGGTRGLKGCVKGAPVPPSQSHLLGPGGGKGESYCINSHSRLIAFHLLSRSWPFSPRIQ